ncbi:MAG TPA: TonB-dependent receptor [Steroidobacteraceae bacterium]|nr:TonB-dependent receptor [Steroidobacteraceae bacterium]
MNTVIRTTALAACMILSLQSFRARAAAGPGDPLDEVVVTATRVAEPASLALEPVLVIDRAELEDSVAIDLGDVLRYHAGFDIGRNGGPGQPLSLFIRGTNSDQSIVMIDGVRINSGTQAIAPLMNLSPELFDRIEIVEGPRSTIYGTDAIGGVVNLITRTNGASGADVLLDYGRYGTGEFALDGNYSSGGTGIQAALTGQQSAGFPTYATDTLDSAYKNLSGTAAFTTHLGGLELGARYYQATGATDYANAIYNTDFTAFTGFTPLNEHFTNSLLAAHASGDLTDAWHTRITWSRVVDDLRQRQDDPYAAGPIGDFDYTARQTIDWQNDIKTTSEDLSQTFTFGAIIAEEQTNSLSYGTGYSIDTHTETYYLQDQLTEGANRLLLAFGEARHPAFGDHTTYNAEYGYSITRDTSFVVSAGTAFRAPTATDRFGFGGTPSLLPESSRNFEIGIKSRIDAHQQITFAAFQNTINDLIVFVNDPNLLYGGENQNVDRARIRGLEASWELLADPWTVHLEGSLQDPRDLVDNSQLLRRTKHSFTLDAARKIGRGEIGMDLLLSGPRPDLDIISDAPMQDGGYLLASLYGKLHLTREWSVSLRLDNALNRRYELADGYNTSARSASISTRYSFR